MKKDVVAGLGEIGMPILKILSKKSTVIGFDTNQKLMNNLKYKKFESYSTSFLHIAIPVTNNFSSQIISLFKKFSPECIVIHSTIGPGTTETLQKKLTIPVIYSATRGVHRTMQKNSRLFCRCRRLSNFGL